MAGRPARKAKPPAQPSVPGDEPQAPRRGPGVAPNHSALSPEVTPRQVSLRTLQGLTRVPVALGLSTSYSASLDVDVEDVDPDDPDALRGAVLNGLREKRRQVGSRLKVADFLAASLIRRAYDPGAKDGVLALRELADRTEGPVVQRTQDVSVRYVVSVGPTNAVSDVTSEPINLIDWEARARQEAGLLGPSGEVPGEAQVGFPQDGRGGK